MVEIYKEDIIVEKEELIMKKEIEKKEILRREENTRKLAVKSIKVIHERPLNRGGG